MPHPTAPQRPCTDPTVRVPRQRNAKPLDEVAVRELDGLGQVTALVRDGFSGLPSTHRSPRRAAIWVAWLTGIVADAWTTLVMLGSGTFEEGNPGPAAGMALLGVPGYVAVASTICLLMAVVSTGRPSGSAARVAVGFLLLVGAGKLLVAAHNLLVWRALS